MVEGPLLDCLKCRQHAGYDTIKTSGFLVGTLHSSGKPQSQGDARGLICGKVMDGRGHDRFRQGLAQD